MKIRYKLKWRFRKVAAIVRYIIGSYKYDSKRYLESFLYLSNKLSIQKRKSDIDKVIYCFWTGNNPLSKNRKLCLRTIEKNSMVKVVFVTHANLHLYIKSNSPLHPAYEYLSLVHKSDYLRCYFMHHYGGGYTDIKKCRNSWVTAFNLINLNVDKWALGYREVSEGGVVSLPGALGRDLKLNYISLIGNGGYIFQADTPFTCEWLTELHNRLDLYFGALKECPGNIRGDNVGYPVPWSNILGDIFHPLSLKYSDKIIQNMDVQPHLKDYM